MSMAANIEFTNMDTLESSEHAPTVKLLHISSQDSNVSDTDTRASLRQVGSKGKSDPKTRKNNVSESALPSDDKRHRRRQSAKGDQYTWDMVMVFNIGEEKTKMKVRNKNGKEVETTEKKHFAQVVKHFVKAMNLAQLKTLTYKSVGPLFLSL